MSTTDTTEKGLETLIMRHMTGMDGLASGPAGSVAETAPLCAGNGWFAGHPSAYDREYAVDAEHLEVAAFNEWGGKNADGSDGFKEHRPGWEMPIHQLLVRNHVAAVFKAHDNFYAQQELDGIVYQMIPQPSFAGNDRIRDLETYGYKKGTFLGNSGHVRVSVTPDKVTVEYVRSWQPQDETPEHKNGEVAHRYSIH